MNQGWRFDSYRHSLAARGVRTSYYSSKVPTWEEIAMKARELRNTQIQNEVDEKARRDMMRRIQNEKDNEEFLEQLRAERMLRDRQFKEELKKPDPTYIRMKQLADALAEKNVDKFEPLEMPKKQKAPELTVGDVYPWMVVPEPEQSNRLVLRPVIPAKNIRRKRNVLEYTKDEEFKRLKAEFEGKKPKNKYMAYTTADLPLIAADGIGTAGAATVSLIPVIVPVAALFGGAYVAKKAYKSTTAKEKK